LEKENRKRRQAFFRFSFLALIIITIVISSSCSRRETSLVTKADTPFVKDSAIRPCREQCAHNVQKGETFAAILKNLGITPAYSARISGALCGAGLVKLFPGDSLILTYDTACSLIKLSLLSRMECWYHAACRDSLITAERKPLAITASCEILNGTLETSLLDVMQQYGLGPYLACRLSDIFAWDINFFLDPREGDTFQILFSRKYADGRFMGYGDILAARYRSVNGRDYYAIGFPVAGNSLDYFDLNGRSVQKEFLKAPLRYARISSGFTYHRRHPIRGIVMPHFGIDYAAPPGTPVYAAADGIVRKAGYDKNNGNHVEIAHGGEFTTCYGHLATISSSVRCGNRVEQGQMIGTVGSTGLATGPHLDYRMKRHGSAVNPLTVELPSKRGIVPSETEEFSRVKGSYCALLLYRFPHREGHYIIDITASTPTRMSAGNAHVDKSGS
jgi:murein DD-endopeptidase MepM/ murein hydrolase activator NlpD